MSAVELMALGTMLGAMLCLLVDAANGYRTEITFWYCTIGMAVWLLLGIVGSLL